MKCPYCRETIKEDANVCKFCLRDIYYINDEPMTKYEFKIKIFNFIIIILLGIFIFYIILGLSIGGY